ncbi:DUF4442 domain-containing protein [Kitasatospora sp. NPDC051853]|uniref:DUF4442 domain-containing protein n=1 Tax=Kitasatospora sp. NPDC051853 TaxID=3364058 RepID=UPI00378E4ADD
MTMTQIGQLLDSTVPMAHTLGLEYLETTPERAVLRLQDRPEYRNHVGGPHAGAMFTLAETASGCIVLAAFGDQLGRAVPLVVKTETAYLKLAKGVLTATATLGRPIADVVAELDKGERPEFEVTVDVAREDGDVTSTMKISWTLRPNS